MIWDTHRHVTDRVFQQEKVLELIENRIAAICMHTNLDEAEDGVDDTLAETLGLTPVEHLAEGRIGHICQLDEPMVLSEFLALAKDKLKANGLRYCDSGKPVQRVALGCGSCGEYLEDAVRAGCDTFLTGDVKYKLFYRRPGLRNQSYRRGPLSHGESHCCQAGGKAAEGVSTTDGPN